MIKIFNILIFSFILLIVENSTDLTQYERNYQDLNDYAKNLNIAGELYVSQKEIPEEILLKLIPSKHEEFSLYYETTYPDNKFQGTGFFYSSSTMIFGQVIYESNDRFYLPSIQLASFADGEYTEGFIENLDKIINLDQKKFCNAIKGKKYLSYNPIKYYYAELKCE